MEKSWLKINCSLIRRKGGNKRSLVEVGRKIGIINESCMLNCLGKMNIGKARHPSILVRSLDHHFLGYQLKGIIDVLIRAFPKSKGCKLRGFNLKNIW